MSKHTPGPWEVGTEWNGKPRLMVRSKEGESSFEIAVLLGNYDERESNARLIACAPEMLEALRNSHMHELDGPMPDGFSWEEHQQKAPGGPVCALIAKATEEPLPKSPEVTP